MRKKYIHNLDKFKDVKPGCDVKVSYKIKEQDKERILHFTGLVIARKGADISETITVRNIIEGVGVERIFPLRCPSVVNIEVLKKGKTRRAKLYYMRKRVGRATRLEEKFTQSQEEMPKNSQESPNTEKTGNSSR
ncbi:MAG: 50S ribosomal protein L19 [Planctomycetota bacterium]